MKSAASVRTRRALTTGALVLALGGGLTACGGEDESNDLPAGLPTPTATTETPPPAETETTPAETTPTEEPAGEVVEVAADPEGQLAYVQKELEAPAGKVTFAFTNESPVPHDFVIEKDGDEVAGSEVIMESEEDVDADLEAGEYTYFCSVPGHRQAGMEGTLTAQ